MSTDQPPPDDPARRDLLEANLADVRGRIAAAARSAGRPADDVTLIVVTKFFPASDVRLLADLGVTDVGENRHQEAMAKQAEVALPGLRWHFIGGLQSNKAAAVAGYADAVHSVDRPKLVAALGRGARERRDADGADGTAGKPLDVLVQVSLDPPGAGGARSGVDPGDSAALEALADLVADDRALRLRGVMGVAPREGEAAEAFARLAEIAARLRARQPSATWLSAGMSGDLEAAVEHGATHVRVGSAVLGPRPQVQ